MRLAAPSLRPPRTARGFTMIELLLVAFILSIGLLGLAALQVAAMRGHLGSKERDAAAYLSISLLDQLVADGQLTAAQRANGGTISTTALLANAALDTVIPFRTGGATTNFNIRGYPCVSTSPNPDESAPVFTASYVVRASAAKDGNPAILTSGDVKEVVVNVTWMEAAATGTTPLNKSISMSRYIRF